MSETTQNRAGLVFVELLALLSEMFNVISADTLNVLDESMHEVLGDDALSRHTAGLSCDMTAFANDLMIMARRAGESSGLSEEDLLDRTFEKLWNATEIEYCTDNGDAEFRGGHTPSSLPDLAKKYQKRLAAIRQFFLVDGDKEKLVDRTQLELQF